MGIVTEINQMNSIKSATNLKENNGEKNQPVKLSNDDNWTFSMIIYNQRQSDIVQINFWIPVLPFRTAGFTTHGHFI